MGHYAVKCRPSTYSTRVWLQPLQVVITVVKIINDAPMNDIINPNWILLDTCSTIISINNEDFFKDIRTCDAGG